MDDDAALTQLQGGLHRVGQPFPERPAPGDLQPVHHRFDGVFLVTGQGLDRLDLLHEPIDPYPGVSLPLKPGHHLPVFSFAVVDGRRQNEHSAALGHIQYLVDHTLGVAFAYGLVAFYAGLMADAGEEHPQIVVDFSDGADGGAGIFAGRLLFDGDGR